MNAFLPLRPRELAVSCRGLCKSFKSEDGPIHALRDVDFDVARGELVMIVGPSGCGKTTLISVIAAMLSQDKGNCHVLGANLSQLTEHDKSLFRRDGMGFVFQSYNLIPTITICENVAVPLLLSSAGQKTSRARAIEMLDRLGLSKKLNAWPSQLSGGQQQRASIARALVHEPSLVICDEPTSALDHATGRVVMELLRETMCNKGKSLIIVTHDNRIFPFADRIVEMNDGEIVSSSNQHPRNAPAKLGFA
jgi:putative ABC transport system ATP-binding protein